MVGAILVINMVIKLVIFIDLPSSVDPFRNAFRKNALLGQLVILVVLTRTLKLSVSLGRMLISVGVGGTSMTSAKSTNRLSQHKALSCFLLSSDHFLLIIKPNIK